MTVKVLYIEDNNTNADMVRAFFRHLDVEYLRAKDGISGTAMAREHRPDIILMDLRMPMQDGLTTTRAIKAEPELAHVPVVIVTADPSPVMPTLADDVGFDDYITKPVTRRQILEIIKKHLGINLTPQR